MSHKPQPRFGWHGEEHTACFVWETLPDAEEYRPPENAWLLEEIEQERTVPEPREEFAGNDWRKDYPLADLRKGQDLVAQLRGGPITSPWIERGKAALEFTQARRAIPGGKPGSIHYDPDATHPDRKGTVIVGAPVV